MIAGVLGDITALVGGVEVNQEVLTNVSTHPGPTHLLIEI